MWLLIGSFQISNSVAQNLDKLPTGNVADYSLKLEIRQAIKKGAKWIVAHQDKKGFWSDEDHPAVSGFALYALLNNPLPLSNDAQISVDKGIEYILSKSQPDGGFYSPDAGLANYNTSLSIMALTAASKHNPNLASHIKKARSFVVKGQFDFDEKGVVDNPLDGGIGYGNSYPHSDMSNTVLALEALRYSEAFKGEKSIPGENDINWEAALKFISKCQNLPSTNKEKWASDDPQNKGGFVYFPGNTKSDTVTLLNGRVALRSYGSISYAGLLSLAYAKLDSDDPRVAAVTEWLSSNYTLDENPGMDQQGLFYYFHTMSKALSAANIQNLHGPENKIIDWRKDLALKLMDLQKVEGHWVNPTSRWWEKDPHLVTSYCLIALELIEASL